MVIDVAVSRGELTGSDLEQLRREYAANPAHRIAANALGQTSLTEIALDRAKVTSVDHTFSHVIDDEWATTHQHQTGRCWIFAALNLFRFHAKKKMNLKEFEFSQSYVMFWDKLERANYVLQTLLDTALEWDDDDRTLQFIYQEPLQDAGQWDMLVNIVNKYGLVPKAAMPDTHSGANTREMNKILFYWLRYGGKSLRSMTQLDYPRHEIEAFRAEIMATIYRVLRLHLGEPPTTLRWQWTDNDGVFHRDDEMTPVEFARKYVDLPLDDYVCLVNDPRNEYGRTYTIDRLGNMVGGKPVLYLNVEMELLKRLAMDAVVGGEPVWFGCDADKMWRHDLGVMDHGIYDFDTLYGAEFPVCRKCRLLYRESQMTHAMLFTGVNVVDGAPTRWRVEDSYGTEPGKKGFHIMTNGWFEEYLYEIATRRDRLPAQFQDAFSRTPVVLPLWDPMGALAR
jgi:bleomycin hydrolase